MTCSCAGEVAIFASKRLLATMNQHVCFQISSSLAWVAALIALWVFYIPLKHLRFEFLGNLEGVISLNIHMSQYWLCSVCISVVDSFSSHCVAFNEPGNKAVGQKQKQKLFQKWGYLGKVKLLDWSKIYFAPPFQPQVGVFFLHVIFQIELN